MKNLYVSYLYSGVTAYIVCHYHPQGNLIGEFRENVPSIKKELEQGLRTPSDTSIDDRQLACGGEISSKPVYTSNIWGMSFDEQCLNSHNKYRSMHGCPPLVLNEELSTYATEWAQVTKPLYYFFSILLLIIYYFVSI